jgi:hypothetical protein
MCYAHILPNVTLISQTCTQNTPTNHARIQKSQYRSFTEENGLKKEIPPYFRAQKPS